MEAERKQMGKIQNKWETNRKQVDKQWGAFEHQWKTRRKAMRMLAFRQATTMPNL